MNKVSYYLSLPVLYLIALLPFPILYLLSNCLKFIIFDIIGYRKEVIITNLKNSFPYKTEQEIQQIANKFYLNFTDMLLECVKMLTLSRKQIAERFIITNPEYLLTYQDKGKGLIAVVGHMINWEWAGLIQSHNSPYPALVIYKPLKNEKFDELVLKIRSKFNAVLIPMKQTLRKLISYRDKPFLLILAGDQYPGKKDSTYKTTFLNQPTHVFMGTEKTAKMMNCPVVFCDIRKTERGRYKVTFFPLVENPNDTAEGEITEMHINQLEKAINEQPEIWLWSHRRWK
ncbi:lysophospholipid acyltransferase family protein [Solitalea sp. MAHUQ-68]|uniref:Lysophospholipid acyltransferase family protein n=1 Tax=Solitalea agri TaxID=2953739 RepID=A0A9X2FCQ9_9SPHI|nr:lysophospholipid acyltransferase family protein [Solitalea agri]